MKIIEDTLEAEIGTWDDPGDYPSGAGSGPLPSYNYIEGVTGSIVIQLEDGDGLVAKGSYDSLEEVDQNLFEILSEAEPDQVNVLKWNISVKGKVLTITVEEMESDGEYESPEVDYEPENYYD